MNFMLRFSPATPNPKRGTSALRSSVSSAPPRYLFSFKLKLIELPARGPWRSFALTLVGLPRFFCIEATLFASSDAPMGPQTFENHFGGGRRDASVLAIGNAESANV